MTLKENEINEYGKVKTSPAFERHKLEVIFRESPAAMALWRGPNMVFEMVNPIYQALFPGRELLGKPFLEAIPEFIDQPFLDIFKKVLETGESFIGHEVLAHHRRSQSGPLEDRYYDFTYVRIVDLNGKPYGVYDHAIDVTDRVLARRALEESKNQLQTAIERLKQERELREHFVSTLSHDLRTPLTAARMNAQLLTGVKMDADTILKVSGRIVENIERADQMISDLLDANRINAGETLPIEIDVCDLNQIASDTIADMSAIYGNRFVLLSKSSIKGYWSRSGIRRVLENLCNNAIKYGAVQRPITIRLFQGTEKVTLEVHNEGSLISPENQAKIFDPFTRAGSAQASGQKGWGLGLTLVKGIAAAHGGSAGVESSQEKGTIFRVELPLDARKLFI
jgi:signal transduction histidine kinase